MKSYPLTGAPRYPYRGANPAKLRKAAEYNRVADRVVRFINDDLKDKPADKFYRFSSRTLARDLGEDDDIVHKVIFSIDCGHNGITIVKGDYDKAMFGPRE